MSWKHNGNLEDEFVAMQPENNFIYQQIQFDEQQKQYFQPPQSDSTDNNACNTDGISSRSVAIQEKLALMNRIQKISLTRSYGEHATLSDWNNSDNIEEETIGMMRHFGMFSLAEGNLDKNNTLPVTVQTNGVYISTNGKSSIPIVLEEGYFRPRRHNSGHRHFMGVEEKYCRPPPEPPLRSDLDILFCNPPPAPKRIIQEKYFKPPVSDLARQNLYPSPSGVVEKQLYNLSPNIIKPTHHSKECEQYLNQPSNRVKQKENFEPLPHSINMAEEQSKHTKDVLNIPRHSLISNSEYITEPRPSGISQFNHMLPRNRTIRKPSHWQGLFLHSESNSIDKVSNIVEKCANGANMESKKFDPEAISAFADIKSNKPKDAKRKRTLPIWSSGAEMKGTASSSSSNSDYFSVKSSSSSSFFSVRSSSTRSNEAEEEEVNENIFGNFNKKLEKEPTDEDISKSQGAKTSKPN